MPGRLLFGVAAIAGCLALHADAPVASVPALSDRNQILIEEAYNLWASVADSIWPGASKVGIPFVFVDAQREYAIGFPKHLDGFGDAGVLGPHRRGVQVRVRTLDADSSASFPVNGIVAAVMGTPEALRKSPGEWIITSEHEMFHVFQGANGSFEKIASLEIGPRDDALWQLNFPFPYEDADVMRLIHLQGYLCWLASTSTDADDASYNVAAALEAAAVYRSHFSQLAAGEKAYRYSQLQQWSEGVAAYIEYKFAEAAARKGYQPTQAYADLPGFESYDEIWRRTYQWRPFLAKHAGRAAKTRDAFYHLGMAKALALDKVNPAWKAKYFFPGVWLDDLLAAPGQKPQQQIVLL
jgi:hypothetical protein